MSNETKVGLLAVVSIALFIWLYKFMKGQNLLTTSNLYYVEYVNVDQLNVSSPVLINGFEVGVVTKMYLNPDNIETVMVELDIRNDIKLPKNTVAEIYNTSMMGGKAINLEFAAYCTGENCAVSGDRFKGITKGMIASMLGDSDVDGYIDKASVEFGQMVDVLNRKLEDPDTVGIGKLYRNMDKTMANLNATTASLNQLMARSSGQMTGILTNFESISKNLAANNAQITSMMQNANTFSKKMANLELDSTLSKTNVVMDNTTASMKQLKTTLESTEKTLADVKTMFNNINEGKGTLGKLAKDESFYHNINKATATIDSFLTELKAKPYKYIPLKNPRKLRRHEKQAAKQ